MDSTNLVPTILFGFIFFVILLIVIAYFVLNEKLVTKRKLRKTLATPVGLCKEGTFVKVVGRIEFSGPPLIAPLSGRQCVYYHVVVDKKKSTHNYGGWYTIIEEEEKNNILLKQGNDLILVKTEYSNILANVNSEYQSGYGKDASTKLENFLNKHGHDSTGFLGFNKAIQYYEGRLEEFDTVAVAGYCYWSDSKSEGLQGEYRKILVIDCSEKDPALICDQSDFFK